MGALSGESAWCVGGSRRERGGCSSYLKEQVVGNEGRDLARQDLIGHGKDSGFYFKHDEKRV